VTTQISSKNFNWLLSSFVENTLGAEHALAVSSDGLLIGISASMPAGEADRLAAVVTGLQALSEGACKIARKGVLNRVVVDMEEGYLLVAMIADGSTLGVLADLDCDLGLVSYEMCMLIDRVGEQLTPELVAELQRSVQ
jgi:uncharacterized protein